MKSYGMLGAQRPRAQESRQQSFMLFSSPAQEVEVIHDPEQFDDTCHLHHVCVTVPFPKRPAHFYFPQCSLYCLLP